MVRKVKLIVMDGYGNDLAPYDPESAEVIYVEYELPNGKSVVGIVLPGEDENDVTSDSVRADEIHPVLHSSRVDNLTGKVLTMIEATFTDKEQRNAMKDVFRQLPWQWYDRCYELVAIAWEYKKGKRKSPYSDKY